MQDKDTRKKKVLDIIIKAHIETGEPVGSKYLSHIIGLSSATIRNVMSELEEEGYLRQPHTSAGRVPTERAYRAYVNSALQSWDSVQDQIKRINEELFMRYHKYNELIERTSYAISKLTNYTSFVVYPMDHIYMDGTSHIVEQPEFDSLKKMRKILSALDEKERVLKMMNAYIQTGALKIHIGQENNVEAFSTCAVITASYKIKNKVVGGVGIIGPIRMKYKRVVPLVKYMADSVSRVLEKMYE